MSTPDDLGKSVNSAAPGTRSGRVGVYDSPDADGTTGRKPDNIGVYDRPEGAARPGFSPAVIAVVAAIVIAIALLIWAF